MNLPTIIISTVLAAIIVFAVIIMLKNKRNGRCSCGCNGCAYKDSCRKKKQ